MKDLFYLCLYNTSPHECFTYSFSSEVAFEQNRYDKVKLKESLSSVTAKLNDAIIFFGKRKSTELF
jgi:hypothetical protein